MVADALPSSIRVTILDHSPGCRLRSRGAPTPTAADAVAFRVDFNEGPLRALLTPCHVALTPGSLASSVAVTGADPEYTVTVTMSDPNEDGSIGITIPPGVLVDVDGQSLYGRQFAALHNPKLAWFYHATGGHAGIYGGFAYVRRGRQLWSHYAAWPYRKWDAQGSNVGQWGPTTPFWSLTGLISAYNGTYWCEVTFEGARPAGLECAPNPQKKMPAPLPPAHAFPQRPLSILPSLKLVNLL